MLAAMNHIQEVKRKAPDAGTELINSKCFTLKKTMISFQGVSEREIIKMIAALLVMKSHGSSEYFYYLLMSDLVCFIDKLIKSTN